MDSVFSSSYLCTYYSRALLWGPNATWPVKVAPGGGKGSILFDASYLRPWVTLAPLCLPYERTPPQI